MNKIITRKDSWRQIKLGNVVKSNRRNIGKDYHHEKIQYLDTGSITKGKIDSFQIYKLSEAPSRAKRLVKDDDIIYSTVRPIQRHYGFIKNPPSNLVVSTGFSVIEIDKLNADPLFIYYLLTSKNIVEELDMIADGATTSYPSLRPSDIEGLDITLPPLIEQKAIAEVLSSLDDKIDLLHHQNKTLEGMAQTLFRKWFVEDVGEDWKVTKLGEVLDFNPTYKLSKRNTSPYLKMGNINSNAYAPLTWYDRIFSSGMKFMNGDTLLARITPCLENGKTCFVDFLNENEVGWGSTEYIVMRSKKTLHPFLSYVIARHCDFRDFAISSMTGSSGRQRAEAKVLKEYEIAIPPKEFLVRVNEHFEIITLKLRNNSKQIHTLENLRNLLLPRLMSGMIRVKF